MKPASDRIVLGLGVAFGVVFVGFGWAPHDRGDWLLENLISAPVALGLVLARKRLPFSTLAWCLVFGFLTLHEIGSHYTYSRVPWTEWVGLLSGDAPEPARNHYDRVVHLAFGLMCTRPIAEATGWRITARPWMLRLLPIFVVMTGSSVYELLEWGAARVVDPELGVAFVGAQGDVWDAQKDMALALLGSIVATGLDAMLRRRGAGRGTAG